MFQKKNPVTISFEGSLELYSIRQRLMSDFATGLREFFRVSIKK